MGTNPIDSVARTIKSTQGGVERVSTKCGWCRKPITVLFQGGSPRGDWICLDANACLVRARTVRYPVKYLGGG